MGISRLWFIAKEMDDSDITGNIFTENTMGIYADGANRIELKTTNSYRTVGRLKSMQVALMLPLLEIIL